MCNNDTKPTFSSPLPPRLQLLDLWLRILVIPLGVATSMLTVTNREDNRDYGSLEYSNFSGLKYMVFVSAVSSGYAVLALVSSWFGCFLMKGWVFFVSDQVMAYMMVTSVSAVVETLYLAHKGDVEVAWSEACSSYRTFCYKMELAVAIQFLALFCFIVLALISAYRAFSIFDLPVAPIQHVEEEQRN
ncbi:hypothetical protein Droror1_Dr00014795 [Drosera rotundifolia]